MSSPAVQMTPCAPHAPAPPISLDIVRCSRCQQSLSLASQSNSGAVQFGMNSYYCSRCASKVGFVRWSGSRLSTQLSKYESDSCCCCCYATPLISFANNPIVTVLRQARPGPSMDYFWTHEYGSSTFIRYPATISFYENRLRCWHRWSLPFRQIRIKPITITVWLQDLLDPVWVFNFFFRHVYHFFYSGIVIIGHSHGERIRNIWIVGMVFSKTPNTRRC